MAYEMVMPYHLHMPSYFLETFTEYPYCKLIKLSNQPVHTFFSHLAMAEKVKSMKTLFFPKWRKRL